MWDVYRGSVAVWVYGFKSRKTRILVCQWAKFMRHAVGLLRMLEFGPREAGRQPNNKKEKAYLYTEDKKKRVKNHSRTMLH
jgi:hypothetical protein